MFSAGITMLFETNVESVTMLQGIKAEKLVNY